MGDVVKSSSFILPSIRHIFFARSYLFYAFFMSKHSDTLFFNVGKKRINYCPKGVMARDTKVLPLTFFMMIESISFVVAWLRSPLFIEPSSLCGFACFSLIARILSLTRLRMHAWYPFTPQQIHPFNAMLNFAHKRSATLFVMKGNGNVKDEN